MAKTPRIPSTNCPTPEARPPLRRLVRRSHRPRHPSIRRLMAIVAGSAVACAGIQCTPCPGWHFPLPMTGGLRVGACRDDADGRQHLTDGTLGRGTFLAGAWRSGHGERAADVVAGVKYRDGWCCLYWGTRAPVMLW